MLNFEEKRGQELRKNNRVFARSMFPKETEINYRVMGFKTQQKGALHSISQSGLFIKSVRIPALGTELNMHFSFGNRTIQCQGRVIYFNMEEDGLNTQGFGVKFTRMVAEDYSLIKSTVDEFHNVLKV